MDPGRGMAWNLKLRKLKTDQCENRAAPNNARRTKWRWNVLAGSGIMCPEQTGARKVRKRCPECARRGGRWAGANGCARRRVPGAMPGPADGGGGGGGTARAMPGRCPAMPNWCGPDAASRPEPGPGGTAAGRWWPGQAGMPGAGPGPMSRPGRATRGGMASWSQRASDESARTPGGGTEAEWQSQAEATGPEAEPGCDPGRRPGAQAGGSEPRPAAVWQVPGRRNPGAEARRTVRCPVARAAPAPAREWQTVSPRPEGPGKARSRARCAEPGEAPGGPGEARNARYAAAKSRQPRAKCGSGNRRLAQAE